MAGGYDSAFDTYGEAVVDSATKQVQDFYMNHRQRLLHPHRHRVDPVL